MAHPPRRPRSLRSLPAVVATAAAVALAPSAPAIAGMHDGPPVETVTWKGEGRTLTPVDTVAVAGASFNRFLARTFAELDGSLDGEVVCAAVSTITVKRWRSDGYASLATTGPCAGPAQRAIAVREDRRWSMPASLTGRTPECTALSSFSVPPAMHRRGCTVPNGTRVAYRDWYWNKVDDRGNPR